jgi:hypothetical protein
MWNLLAWDLLSFYKKGRLFIAALYKCRTVIAKTERPDKRSGMRRPHATCIIYIAESEENDANCGDWLGGAERYGVGRA